MADVLSVVTVLVAFAALAGFVRLCDRLVGPDDPTSGATPPATPSETAR